MMAAAVAVGTVRAPPSKSVTHRTYLLAAQTDSDCTVHHPLQAADTDVTLDGLVAMGAQADRQAGQVRFAAGTLHAPASPVDCRNAGTALRLFTGTAARFPGVTVLDGDASLRGRPNHPLVQAMRSLGAQVDAVDDDHCPLRIQGPIHPGEVRMPGDASSQFISSLLLSLPMLDGPSTIHVEGPVASKPYLDLTCGTAARFGLRIDAEGDTFHVLGGDRPRGGEHMVEGDWSAAAFPFAAAALTGGKVTVEGLDPHSAQGDRRILEHLASFGCTVHTADDAATVEGGALRSPGTIDVRDTPDLFPALVAVAACAEGTTTFTGGAALRLKESDRIHAMAVGLAALGIRFEERPDGLTVHAGTPKGGIVHAFHDHRIHMAFQVLALAADGDVQVDGAATPSISYPTFHDHLARLTEGTS